MKNPLPVAGLVLAAGSSSRMGQPKQLLEFEGQCLVARAVNQLIESGCSSVTTVLGANSEIIGSVLQNVATKVVSNKDWSQGIGTSIAYGVTEIPQASEAVLIALGDQPLIRTQHYRNLLQQFSINETTIAATQYPDGRSGVPALFIQCHFSALRELEGDSGAQSFIRRHPHSRIDVNGELLDLDTPDDVARLRQSQTR